MMGRILRGGALGLSLFVVSCHESSTTLDVDASYAETFDLSIENGSVLTLPTGESPVGLAVGPFNGDAKDDIAVAHDGANYIVLYMQNANDTFTLHPGLKTKETPRFMREVVRFEKLDGEDGEADATDLAVLTQGANGESLETFTGNGDGMFPVENTFAAKGASCVLFGDLDEDKWDDAIFVYPGNQFLALSLLMNTGGEKGGGLKPEESLPLNKSPKDVAIGDINNDGDDVEANCDIAVLAGNAAEIHVFLQGNANGYDQDNAKVTQLPDAGEPARLTLADLNGDGILDALVLDAGDDSLHVLLGDDADNDDKGDGTFSYSASYETGESPASMDTGDLNGDGAIDAAVANAGSDTVTVLLGVGDGTFVASTPIETGREPRDIRIGEFGKTDLPDVAVVNGASNTLTIVLR